MKHKTKYNKLGMSAFVLLTTLSTQPFAHAQGDKTGGGGDVLTCLENGKANLYLLDMYEAGLKGKVMRLGNESLSIQEKIILVRERFAELDPVRANTYATEALKMIQDIEAQENGLEAPHGLVALVSKELKDIDDADEIYNFSGSCKKAQLVRQEKPIYARDPYYTIDQRYWHKMKNDQKVATLYHEVIYKEMRQSGMLKSKGARALNALLMTGEIKKVKSGEYRDLLISQNVRPYLYAGLFDAEQSVIGSNGEIVSIGGVFPLQRSGLSFEIVSPTFNQNREFTSAALLSTFDIEADSSKLVVNQNYNDDLKRTMGKYFGGRLEFDRNGGTIIRGLKKNPDPGLATITLDAQGKIISRTENGYFNKPISAPMTRSLSMLLACTRSLVQTHQQADLAKILLETARDAIKTENLAMVSQLIDDCTSRSTHFVATAFSKPSEKIVSGFQKPTAVECHGANLSASGGIVLAGKIGLATFTCLFSDGSRHFYFGPQVGIQLASFTANVSFGAWTVDPKLAKIDKRGMLILSGTDSDDTKFQGIKVPASMQGQRQVAYQMMGAETGKFDNSEEFGIGFNGFASEIDTAPMLKVFRKKDRFTYLVNDLVTEIWVDKSQN